MTFNDKWNGEFDVKFVKNKGEDEEYYRVWLRDDMIKEFITSRQNFLLDEIVEKLEKERNIQNKVPIANEHGEGFTKGFNSALQDAITIIKTYKI